MPVKNLLKQELAPLNENLERLKAKPSEIKDNEQLQHRYIF